MGFLFTAKESLKMIFRRPPNIVRSFDYDQYWKDKRKSGLGSLNSFQLARADWVKGRLLPGSSLLDVGSGDGGVLMHITKSVKLGRTIAADVSEYALTHLKSQGFDTVTFNINDPQAITQIPAVDYITLLEVLEHLPDPETLLAQLEKKASKSIFFSFPNTGYFAYRLRLLFGRFPVQWRLQPGEHLRFWTYRDLKWWLDQLGYAQRATIYTYEGLPFLNRLCPSWFAMGFVVELKIN